MFKEYFEYVAFHKQIVQNGYVFLEDSGNNMQNGGPTGEALFDCEDCGYEGRMNKGSFQDLLDVSGRIDFEGRIKILPVDYKES
jgi:hypothetical protein